MKENALVVFKGKKIRRVWYGDEWYFSVVDVVGVLTDSSNPRNYWNMLKKREAETSNIELYTFCVQLKLMSVDGKKYETDCANTESMFRIIQSIPSPKAEPFKSCHADSSIMQIQKSLFPAHNLDTGHDVSFALDSFHVLCKGFRD
ncbi:MAG: Bro-N domain-containing protein [Candidatus Aenigmarchaeota archaeon]|nr:Bro-N domain-containing protein [Candidatus Aenigmarchaeota archaeon]